MVCMSVILVSEDELCRVYFKRGGGGVKQVSIAIPDTDMTLNYNVNYQSHILNKDSLIFQ